MKLGHWILIAIAVIVVIYFATSRTTPTYGYTGGGNWYDRMLASVGIGLGTYVRTAGPNAFGGGASTSGGVRTTNPANDVEWARSESNPANTVQWAYSNSPYSNPTQSGGGTAGLQAYYNDPNMGTDWP